MDYSDQLTHLNQLDSELASLTDLDALLDCILLNTRRIFTADAGSIYVCEGEHLRFAAAQCESLRERLPAGQRPSFTTFTIPKDSRSLAGYAAVSGGPLRVDDVYDIPAHLPYRHSHAYDQQIGYRTRSVLSMPLTVPGGDIVGVLQLINKQDHQEHTLPFTDEDIVLLHPFATRASLALYQARITRALVLRMIRMAELHDPTETGAHANRVAASVAVLYDAWAHDQQLPAPRRRATRDLLRTAAMLHDVGKVGISDLILKKAGPLTSSERQVMEQHTRIGSELFGAGESPLDRMAAEIALNHHEAWDGSGYPRGLRGDQIPLIARMVAIADVFDALRSRRCYKESWSEDDAIDELRSLAGTRFDPHLVDLFLHHLPDIQAARNRHLDS